MSNHSEKVPKAMAEGFAAVTAITDAFCREHLNGEYAQLIRFAAAALCRKRPSPLGRGSPLSWAAGITHAVGSANFLFDPSQTPHLSAGELYKAFGVSPSNALAKSKTARDLLDMGWMRLEWCLPSRVPQHPMAWMIYTEDGLMLDARQMPREDQVVLFNAGYIPFVYADRAAPADKGGPAAGLSERAQAAAPKDRARAEQEAEASGTPPSPQLALF